MFVVALLASSLVLAPLTSAFLKNGDQNGVRSKEMMISRDLFSFKNLRNIYQSSWTSLLTSKLLTNCGQVKKSTFVTFGSYMNLDVDNDSNTGKNGADLGVQYLILPWINLDPLAVGLLFTCSFERLGEEIKDKNFSATLKILDDEITLGYWSPDETGNEIPKFVRLTFMILFSLEDRQRGFGLALIPEYDHFDENKKLVLTAGYKDKSFSLKFEPTIETQFNIFSTKNMGEWRYEFTRESSQTSKVTTTFKRDKLGVTKETTLVVDKLPEELFFNLSLTPLKRGGGCFIYKSSRSYNIELSVESEEMGTCRYATIKNTPRSILAKWTPTLVNGSYSVEIDSDGTDLVFKNSLVNPTINLTVNNLRNINFNTSWNLTNPGNFTVKRKTNFSVDLQFNLENWSVCLNATPVADKICTGWYINTTGYIEVDTDWEPLGEMLLLIRSENLGLKTNAETFKAEDFRLNWTIWPPIEWNLEKEGWIDFFSITMDLFLNDHWYHLWPW